MKNKEKVKQTEKGKNPVAVFNRGKLAKVRGEAYRRERDRLAETSLKDLIR